MTKPTPTAAMIRAGADWFHALDNDPSRDPGYEEIARDLWTAMEAARTATQERWDDATAREIVARRIG